MIDSQETAFSELLRRLYPEKVLWVRNINKSRGKLIKTTNMKIYAVYKRERFMTFGKQFKSQGMTGLGESINREVLNLLIAEDVDRLIVIYPDNMYWIYPKLFKNFAIEKFIENDSGGENSMTIFVNLETIFVIRQNLSIFLNRITR